MKLLQLSLAAVIIFNALAPSAAQDNQQGARELYRQCTSGMRTNPQGVYELCKEYLRKYPGDDRRLVEYVTTWVTAYDQMLPYMMSVRAIAPSGSTQPWFIYEPDLRLEIPQVIQKEGSHTVEIARRFNGQKEDALLRKAEALYPSVDSMVAKVASGPFFFAQYAPLEPEPLWWNSAHSGIRETYVVTARAVRYYYDLSQELRRDHTFVTNFRLEPTTFRMDTTSLKYIAVINHHAQYTRGQEKFRDVYVAELNLEWSQVCGGLCGAGYKRNKVVVFDVTGNVLRLYLDAPGNRGTWVN